MSVCQSQHNYVHLIVITTNDHLTESVWLSNKETDIKIWSSFTVNWENCDDNVNWEIFDGSKLAKSTKI